jgi:hypothetical protein
LRHQGEGEDCGDHARNADVVAAHTSKLRSVLELEVRESPIMG